MVDYPVFKSVKLVPIENILFHKTDTLVKPIIGNVEIEKIEEVRFNAKTLGFETRSSAEIIEGIETHEIESHFADIYNYLSTRNINY